MAKKSLTDLSSFLNRRLARNRFPVDKKPLAVYFLHGKMLRACQNLYSGRQGSISVCCLRDIKAAQSVMRNLSTGANALCDQDSLDLRRIGEVVNFTSQPGRRYEITRITLG